MSRMQHYDEPALPSLTELGRDLLFVSPFEVAVSVLRPLLCFVVFWPLAIGHHYILATLSIVALSFFTYTSTSHDLVHRTLPISAHLTDILLAVIEGLSLRSGHAFRLAHLQHHKSFPQEEDVEGAEAAKGFWTALACGPFHQVRLFAWAWKYGSTPERYWMLAEAIFVACVLITAAVTWSTFPALPLFAVLVIGGSWLYPLATVWWPHRSAGKTPLQQTRGFRGHLIPFLFFQHTFHLEHHLYPGISSHRWAELGRRLEPYLRRAGVEFVRIP